MPLDDESPLIGRADELDRLLSVLTREEGGTALVTGEAGIGKTRLVKEATQRIDSRVLIGSCSPSSFGRPFDLLKSAVEPVVRTWIDVPDELAGVAPALRRLLHGVAPALEDTEAPASPEFVSAGVALLRHLEPAAVVLEDVHWSDVESLQVIERVLMSPDRPAFVLTYRSEEAASRPLIVPLLLAIETRLGTEHVHLQPFSSDEVAEYLISVAGGVVDHRLVEQLLARTGGLPFFLEELVANGGADLRRSDGRGLPWSVAEVIRARLDAFDAAEREVLEMGATLGASFEFDVLMAALGVDERVVIERLRAVVGSRVIVEDELDVFRFRHELVREAVLGSLLGRERKRLHDRAFVALHRLHPDRFSELADHASGADRVQELTSLAPRGVEHYLEQGATHQALILAERAMVELPDNTRLRELAARSAWMIGSLDRARLHASRWHELERRTRSDREGEALAFTGRIAFELGDVETEQSVVEELECRAERGDRSEAHARLLSWLAQHHMLHGNVDRSVELAERAIGLAHELELEDVVRSATVELGSALACDDDGVGTPRFAEGQRLLKSAAEASEAVGDYVVAARAWHNLLVGQTPEIADRTLEAMRRAAACGGFDSMAIYYFAAHKVDLAVAEGDLEAAKSWATRSRLVGPETRTWVDLAIVEALLLVETGADDAALEMLEDVTSGARRFDDPGWVPVIEAVIAARSGDVSSATDALTRISPSPKLAGILSWAFHLLMEAGVDVVAVAEASGILDSNLTLRAFSAAATRSPHAGELIDQAARWESGRVARGAKKVARFGAVVRAELELAAAGLAFDQGNVTAASDRASAAAKILDQWPGVRRDRVLAFQSKTRQNAEPLLTGREIDVARLLAHGMTNGEIADQLFISRKTVSTHVSNILAKLEMRSRTEVAVWAIETGVIESESELLPN